LSPDRCIRKEEGKVTKKASKSFLKSEKGQALLILMLVMLFSSLVLPPMLSYASSGLKTGKDVFEARMYLSYAADAGVEDGLWQVKTKNLPDLFPSYERYGYYEYSHIYEWSYELSDRYEETGIVNGDDVNVTFQNVWMPKDIPAPNPDEAEYIADEGNLVVYGSLSGASATEFQIKMVYYWNANPGDPDYDPDGENLRVQKIGIWLPPGFEYNGSLDGVPTGCTPNMDYVPYKGGKAVVWSFPSSPNYPSLVDFGGATSSDNPVVRSITFEFTGPEGRTPGTALAWMVSTGVVGISYSWDSSVKLYKIVSKATDVAENPEEEDKTFTVEAYAATTDILKRGAAVSGDYCAIGGTLLTTTYDPNDPDWQMYRNKLFKDSYATVQNANPDAPFYIPPDADVDLAYLYWSGWLENKNLIWGDDCSSFANWTHDTDWTIENEQFKGHNNGSGTAYVTMNFDLDLSSYAGQTIGVTWAQSKGGTIESSDELDYAFSGNGGNSWTYYQAFRGDRDRQPASPKTVTIPLSYKTSQFRMRFRLNTGSFLEGSGSSAERAYIDDISIYVAYSLGSLVENTRVNQIRFNGINLTAKPENIQTKVVASSSLYYSCKYDVTSLVTGDGGGTYTVGHVLGLSGDYPMYDYTTGELSGETTAYPLATPAYKIAGVWVNNTQFSYAAWSLVLVYSSPETQGHQLYLYEDFTSAQMNDINFDGGAAGGTIGGFIAPDAIKQEGNAARLTCFVGDGDEHYANDYIEVNHNHEWRLWDGTISTTNPPNNENDPRNVWNSKSLGMAESGIDIDTFEIAYPIIKPGDTSAYIYMPVDEYVTLVYIILSFRSDIVPASTVSYLVK
jgi:hypothetical protein